MTKSQTRIHVTVGNGSSRVSNDALHRACYVARFIFADIYAIRNSLYKRFGRFAIIGTNEKTTDIPEHSWLPDWWNQRARGLGATDKLPVSTAGEENALCSHYDIYIREDIVLHEYAHALHLLGAHYAVPDFREKLSSVFASARLRGLWDNTYASTNQIEYFAEGVQKYFNDDSHSDPPNGIHNHVNTRAKLRDYDIGLHDLIQSLFPCNNQYLLRCDKRRDKELHQKLRINCDGNGGAGGGDSEETGGDGEEGGEGGGSEGGRGFQEGDCQDEHRLCSYWALMGECPHNPGYMHINCRQSCSLCDEETTDEGQSCYDNYRNCAGWARYGECEKNPEYMLKHCRMSCGHCDNNETDKCRDSDEVTHCSSWTRLGYCHHSKFRESMEYYCKRTCNFC